jgi:hypothetical protein
MKEKDKNQPELLDFWVSSIVPYSKIYKTQHFGKWTCFRPQVRGETPALLGPLERPNLYHSTTLVGVRLNFTTGGLRPISSSWRQAPWNSRHSNFISQLNTCGPYVSLGVLTWHPFWWENGCVVYNCCARQHSHSHFRVPRDSWPIYAFLHSRLY